MRRRDFISLLGGAAMAWPFAAHAQQAAGAMRRIGVLINGAATDARRQASVAALVQALRQLGWSEGQNLRIDVRFNAGDVELARIYGAQLIGLMPDVILASSTTNLNVIRQATHAIPVVFVEISDPLAQGLVASLTRPGGNITGFSNAQFSVGGKWLDLLKEITPGLARVAVMFNPETSPQSGFYLTAVQAAAALLSIEAPALPVRAAADIEPALESFARQPSGGLIMPPDTFLSLHAKLIADLTLRLRLPTICAGQGFVEQGVLMCYAVDDATLVDQFRQAAGYIDRILRGAKARDPPVQNADKYTLVINLRTAKALGLTVPLPLSGLADGVIE